MSLYSATLASDNTVYAQLILDLGPENGLRDGQAARASPTKLDCYPAEGLGGLRLGVTPLEMASAYATLAAGGIRHRPTAIRKVVFPDGKSEELVEPEGQARAHRRRGLRGHADPQGERDQSGTGRTASGLGCPAAGKTGTTDNHNDAWFVGYTPHLSTAVWLGYPDALISTGEQGGRLPALDLDRLHAAGQGRRLRRLPAAQGAVRVLARSSASTRAPAAPSTEAATTTASDTYGTADYGTDDGGYDPLLRGAAAGAAGGPGTGGSGPRALARGPAGRRGRRGPPG